MQNPEDEIENPLAEAVPVAAPAAAGNATPAPGNVETGTERRLKFGYLFSGLNPCRPADEKLIELGEAMVKEPDLGEHPTLLAGYTYLGQLITHDITFDPIQKIPDARVDDVHQVQQERRRALELETLYGIGIPSDNVELYEKRKHPKLTYLKIGVTDPIPELGASCSYRNDLPRPNPNDQNKATLGDPRNDANLALAQVTVAFLRFHNKVAEHLNPNNNLHDDTLFERTRKKVVQHYQWVVLHDFLPKIIEQPVLDSVLESVFEDVRENRPRNIDGKWPFIPIEFSIGAFRLGHSMLRDTYEWNRIFQSSDRDPNKHPARLLDLFLLSGRNGTMGKGGGQLPSEWIIDWTRFFDFTGFNGIANNPKSNKARKIDTSLTPGLKDFKDTIRLVITKPEFQSLPVLDLIRGSRYGLPSGQDVAKKLKAKNLDLRSLSPSEIAEGPHRDVLKKHKFDEETPLWYYILKEAQVRHEGKILGPVGSRIVAETFIELLWVSQHSILKEPDWKPDLGQKKDGEFGMADLLVFADVVNPLGC